MNILDSSGWIEYLLDGKNYQNFSECAEDIEHLLVPTIVLYEVMKYVSLWGTDIDFSNSLDTLRSAMIVPLTEDIALESVTLSRDYKLPIADSIILGTAKSLGATLWTQDGHFKDIEGVKYFPKIIQ